MSNNVMIMPDSDLPFSDKLQLRENVLAWISRDVGLHDFFFPSALQTPLTVVEQKDYILNHMSNYLSAPTPLGNAAVFRSLQRETAAHLRRFSVDLRRGQATHRDIARACLHIESLWDGLNTGLDDADWARCSMHFDISLIALRIVYVITYLQAECPFESSNTMVRISVFNRLVSEFFIGKAPTDCRTADKHTANFRDLLKAWHDEFIQYEHGPDFEVSVSELADVQGCKEAADLLDGFLRATRADESWMLQANQLLTDFQAGLLSKRSKRMAGVGRPKKDSARRSPSPEEIPEPESSDSKSDSDSDYAEAQNSSDDAGSNSNDDAPPVATKRSRRPVGRPRKDVRRSRRVADTNDGRRRPSGSRHRRQTTRYDDEDETPVRGRRSRNARYRDMLQEDADEEDEEADDDEQYVLQVQETAVPRKRGPPVGSSKRKVRKVDSPAWSSPAQPSPIRRSQRVKDGVKDADSGSGSEQRGVGSSSGPRRSHRRVPISYVDDSSGDDDEQSIPRARLMKALADAKVEIQTDGQEFDE